MLSKIIDKFTSALIHFHQSYLSAIEFVHIVAIGIGLLCGFCAGLLKLAIDWITHLILDHFAISTSNPLFLLLPIIGILIATVIGKYFTKHPLDHASDRIAEGMQTGNVYLGPKMIIGPMLGCSLTLGLGGSAGAEDPIAYTGGAIGSNMGRTFKLNTDEIASMVGCGASAAIAGIFMAPIGGVMYGLEVLKMKQSLRSILAVVISSLVAALTCYIMLGCHTDVTFVPEMRFELKLIPLVLLCGFACGLYSIYYSSTMAWCRCKFRHISNIWWRALAGGLFMSCALFIFPSLYGEGYNIIGFLMVDEPMSVVAYSPLYKLGKHFDLLLLLMVALLLIKPFATSATNDSGGVGGDFTPTFFCGGIAGFVFAAFFNHYIGLNLPYALFAFFGMSAVMSGAIRAPLMAIFIAAEMTGLYGFILPLTLAALASFVTTLLLSNIHATLPFLHHKKHNAADTTPNGAKTTPNSTDTTPNGADTTANNK